MPINSETQEKVMRLCALAKQWLKNYQDYELSAVPEQAALFQSMKDTYSKSLAVLEKNKFGTTTALPARVGKAKTDDKSWRELIEEVQKIPQSLKSIQAIKVNVDAENLDAELNKAEHYIKLLEKYLETIDAIEKKAGMSWAKIKELATDMGNPKREALFKEGAGGNTDWDSFTYYEIPKTPDWEALKKELLIEKTNQEALLEKVKAEIQVRAEKAAESAKQAAAQEADAERKRQQELIALESTKNVCKHTELIIKLDEAKTLLTQLTDLEPIVKIVTDIANAEEVKKCQLFKIALVRLQKIQEDISKFNPNPTIPPKSKKEKPTQAPFVLDLTTLGAYYFNIYDLMNKNILLYVSIPILARFDKDGTIYSGQVPHVKTEKDKNGNIVATYEHTDLTGKPITIKGDGDNDDIEMNDVLQGAENDCFLLAPLAALAKLDSNLIYKNEEGADNSNSIIKEVAKEKVQIDAKTTIEIDVYVVQFYLPTGKKDGKGNDICERVPIKVKATDVIARVPKSSADTQYNSNLGGADIDKNQKTDYPRAQAADGKDFNQEIWAVVIEQAFVNLKNTYKELDFGNSKNALQYLTGKTPTLIYTKDEGAGDAFVQILKNLKNKKSPITFNSKSSLPPLENTKPDEENPDLITVRKGLQLQQKHAYTLESFTPPNSYKLYNTNTGAVEKKKSIELTLEDIIQYFKQIEILED